MEVLSLSGKLNSSVFKYEDAGNGLENYQINEEIGEGTFGKVYSAIDKKTGESLAIKKITHLEYGTIELVREISILKHMQMNCVLQIKDVVPVYNKESEK
jgi:serine/threonine protein kinase